MVIWLFLYFNDLKRKSKVFLEKKMPTIEERTFDFFIEFQELQSPLCLDELKQKCMNLIEKVKSFVISKRPKNIDFDALEDPTDAPIHNQIIYEIYGVFGIKYNQFIQNVFQKGFNPSLDKLTTILMKTYKHKDAIWYDSMLEIIKMTEQELRYINDDPENIWKNVEKQMSVIYRTTTKMNCPECNASVFINSYLKTHKGSKRCFLATQPKPPKKKGTDRIKCCEECPKEDYYSHSSRMKQHREKCEIYNQSIR